MIKMKDFSYIYEKLKKAAKDLKLISILYADKSGKKSMRTVEPISVSTDPFDPSLYAFCRMRNELRQFKLDKIRTIQILSDTYEPKSRVTVASDITALETMNVLRQ